MQFVGMSLWMCIVGESKEGIICPEIHGESGLDLHSSEKHTMPESSASPVDENAIAFMAKSTS